MPLIELLNTTKLRSLGFGHDRPHGGSSPQPYIQTKIPTKKELDSPSPDFLLRGATNADPFLSTGNDLERIGKWFFQEPTKGLLFIAKQNLLSRTATATDVSDLKTSGKLNGGLYLPTSTLFQIGVSAFGLHVNKQGLNPIPSDPGSGYLQDLLSIGSQPLYGNVVFNNSLRGYTSEVSGIVGKLANVANFLGISAGKKINNPSYETNIGLVSISTFDNFLLKLHSKRILNGTPVSELYSYSGGPGSLLGIGNTSIKFATNAGGIPIRTNLFPQNNIIGSSTNDGFVKGGALAYTQDEIFTYGVPYQNVNGGRVIGNNPISDFRTQLRKRIFSAQKNNLSNIPMWVSANAFEYTDETRIETRTLVGDPGVYTRSTGYLDGDLDKKRDILNTLFPFTAASELEDADKIRQKYDKDLITFKIQVIDNDKPGNQDEDTILYFRAFLDSISDQYTSDWDSSQYIGRGEKFYNYKSFDRSISLGWTVAAQSQAELIPMYTRLNYLASVCAPDYSTSGYMRGNLVKLTIGGYIYEQIGIIKGFTYEMREEFPWEIGLAPFDKFMPQLCQIIKVNGFQFVPIHSQIPRKGSNVFIHRAIPTNKFNTIIGSGTPASYEPENNPAYQYGTTTTKPSARQIVEELVNEEEGLRILKNSIEKPQGFNAQDILATQDAMVYRTRLDESLDEKIRATKDIYVQLNGGHGFPIEKRSEIFQKVEMDENNSIISSPDINSDRSRKIFDLLNKALPDNNPAFPVSSREDGPREPASPLEGPVIPKASNY